MSTIKLNWQWYWMEGTTQTVKMQNSSGKSSLLVHNNWSTYLIQSTQTTSKFIISQLNHNQLVSQHNMANCPCVNSKWSNSTSRNRTQYGSRYQIFTFHWIRGDSLEYEATWIGDSSFDNLITRGWAVVTLLIVTTMQSVIMAELPSVMCCYWCTGVAHGYLCCFFFFFGCAFPIHTSHTRLTPNAPSSTPVMMILCDANEEGRRRQ